MTRVTARPKGAGSGRRGKKGREMAREGDAIRERERGGDTETKAVKVTGKEEINMNKAENNSGREKRGESHWDE